jgi:hypothetical protein
VDAAGAAAGGAGCSAGDASEADIRRGRVGLGFRGAARSGGWAEPVVCAREREARGRFEIETGKAGKERGESRKSKGRERIR